MPRLGFHEHGVKPTNSVSANDALLKRVSGLIGEQPLKFIIFKSVIVPQHHKMLQQQPVSQSEDSMVSKKLVGMQNH
jgi:hypothetical protein